MTTREQQIASAREFAEKNPEWRMEVTLGKCLLSLGASGHMLLMTRRKVTWAAYADGWRRLRGRSRPLAFRSPASAARALGFDVKE